MRHEALDPLAQRIAVTILKTQITRKPSPFPVALDYEPVGQEVRPVLDDLHHLRAVRRAPRPPLPHDLLDDVPRATALALRRDDRAAGRARPAAAAAGEGPVQRSAGALQLLCVGAEKRAGLVECEGLLRRDAAITPAGRRGCRGRRCRAVAEGRGGRYPPHQAHGPLDRRRLQQALVLVPQRLDAAFSGELGGVEEHLDIGRPAGQEGFFQELDHGSLEDDDLALQLILGDHWP